ncbi:hypothetical protein C4J81_14150 [Deltaproteobacteria bacterium Smac51]|nr:hypothetical protein C4J81_14150 [Deltaproteobacteria bacterium Smac51]
MDEKEIFRRVMQITVILLGVSLFSFCLTFLSPGDTAEMMLTDSGNRPSPERLQAVRDEMDLNIPFLMQYSSWLSGVVRDDLDHTLSSKQPVSTTILNHRPATVTLSMVAVVWAAGTLLGALAGFAGGIIDSLIMCISDIAISLVTADMDIGTTMLELARLAILIVVSAFNLLGEGLGDILDPQKDN